MADNILLGYYLLVLLKINITFAYGVESVLIVSFEMLLYFEQVEFVSFYGYVGVSSLVSCI